MTAAAYCEGQDFTLSALQKWSYLLGRAAKQAKASASARTVRLVRVRRAPAEASPSASSITIDVGDVRVTVSAGFDRTTLDALLDLLHARARAGAR
jgi:hypothetical protein